MERLFKPVGKSKSSLPIVLLIVIIFLVFLPILNNGFIWDDEMNITDNPYFRGLSVSHLHWMFTTIHDANYHPLCWVSFGLDYILWGLNPAGYHLTNLVLHILNAVLFYFLIAILLRQIRRPVSDADWTDMQTSAFIGALFWAIHPLRVENVAWVSARGDLLCGVFLILAVIAYLQMVQEKEASVRRKWFLVSLVLFILSLLARAWGMTFPVILLILDVYPLRRFVWKGRSTLSVKRLLIEKIPFALFALGSGVSAFLAKKAFMFPVMKHSVFNRVIQSAYGLSFYLFKTLVPIRLSPLYLLHKTFNPMEPEYIISAFLVIGITGGVIAMRHRWPWAITAWFCYVVIVSPLLGIVQTGPQIVADRYTYISGLPFGVVAGAGVFSAWNAREKRLLSSRGWHAVVAGSLICLALLSVLSLNQTRVWKDSGTFFNRVIRFDPNNHIAFNQRGGFYMDRDPDRAMADFNTSIRLNPYFSKAFYNRALLRHQLGDLAGAISDYSQVIKLDSKYIEAYNNRGSLLKKNGDLSGAVSDFDAAIRVDPNSPEAYVNRGLVRKDQNDFKRAIQDYRKALKVAPADWPHRTSVEKLLKKETGMEKK